MRFVLIRPELGSLAVPFRLAGSARCGALALALVFSAQAQQPAPSATPDAAQQPTPPQAAAPPLSQPAQTPQQPPPAPPAAAPATPSPATPATPAVPTPPSAAAPIAPPAATGSEASEALAEAQLGSIAEEELRQLLVGKALYLRGGYLDNSLSFDEHGRITGHSPQGSYTLSAIQIEHVRLTKHKVELEGARYGLHFLGQLAFEDASSAYDRVRITSKKKVVRITIDREIVVKPKKAKETKAAPVQSKKAGPAAPTTPAAPAAQGAPPPTAAPAAAAPAATPAPPAAQAAAEPAELSEAEQLMASIADVPEAERPADAASVTTTLSPAHATKVLKEALDQIFAPGLDDRMMAAMPDFWRLYYQAVAAKTDYRPKDSSIFRQNTVDQKAVLLTKFEPDSNEFAQASAIAGPALYHAVIGPDGKAAEVAVARPIGFGLDENAVTAIRKASFQPAIKDGKPVPVLLDLYVSFRIYSKRTNVHAESESADKPAEPILPGPYSVLRQ